MYLFIYFYYFHSFLIVALLTMRLLSAGTPSADLDPDDPVGPELTAAATHTGDKHAAVSFQNETSHQEAQISLVSIPILVLIKSQNRKHDKLRGNLTHVFHIAADEDDIFCE